VLVKGPSIYDATIFKGVGGIKKNEDAKVSKSGEMGMGGVKTLKN
jgi:hypothetical protein